MDTEKNGRLLSLDALRGFNMFFITGGHAFLIALSLLVVGHKDSWLAVQMTHVPWIGLHIYDCIFPLFVFITGVTFPFSTAKRLERGDSKTDVAINILRRTALLVFFGLLYSSIQKLDWEHFRVWSVIGRVGLVWGMAAFLTLFFRMRTCIVISIVLLVGWWLLLRFVPAPDAPAGINPILKGATTIAGWIDTHFLTTAHRHEGGLATIHPRPVKNGRLTALDPDERVFFHEKGTLYIDLDASVVDAAERPVGRPSDVAFPGWRRKCHVCQRTHCYFTNRRIVFEGKDLDISILFVNLVKRSITPGGMVFETKAVRFAFTVQNPMIAFEVLDFATRGG